MLDASRHFLANILVNLDHIFRLNFTDCFGRESLALYSNNSLQILFKPFVFPFYQVPYNRTRKRCISPILPVKKNLGTFYFTTTLLVFVYCIVVIFVVLLTIFLLHKK